jgi:outer membrane protein TolC
MEPSTFNLQHPTFMGFRVGRQLARLTLKVGGWMFFSIIFFTVGCAHFAPQPISPEKTAAQLDARRLDDTGLQKFLEQNLGHELSAWPQTNWNFSELTLVGFYFHPSLEVARAQWLVAQAGVTTAGARPNPSASVAPGYDTQIPGNYSPWLVPVTFDVPIETAGKRGKRLAEAEKLSESARWNFVAAAWQIRSSIRASLLDFKITSQRAAQLQKQFAVQKEIVRLQQQRFDAGAIDRPELTTAQIALSKTQLDLNDAQSKSVDARSHLAETLGLSLAALAGENLDLNFSMHDVKELTSAEARRVALCSRADVLAALADYAAAEADLQLEVAKQYPDLHLGPAYSWNSGNAGDNMWSLGATLELPILDRNQGPIAEAEARRKLSAAKFTELQAQIIAAIDRAVAGCQVAQGQWQAGASLLAAQQQQQTSVEARISAGAADQLDGLSAQLEFINTALAQIDNEAQRQRALVALEDAVQLPADAITDAELKLSKTPPAQKPGGH